MQAEFNFQESSRQDGYGSWQQARESALAKTRRELGLPIGRQCEVWLKGGLRLRGLLRLREDLLVLEGQTPSNVRLEIANVPFDISELEGCTRLD